MPRIIRIATVLPILLAATAHSDTQETQLVPLFQQPRAATGAAVALYQLPPTHNWSQPTNGALWAGAPYAAGQQRATGLVHGWAFSEYQGGTWTYTFTLGSSSPQPGAMFGASIAQTDWYAAATGALVAVGSPGYRLNSGSPSLAGRMRGYAEVFSIGSAASAPTTGTVGVLTPSESASDDAFGTCVALASTIPAANPSYWAFASAPGRDVAGVADAGLVSMFRRDSATAYPLVAELQVPDPSPYDRLGRAALAATGSACFASIDRGTGAVAAFATAGGIASFDGYIAPPDAQTQGLGASISVDGDLLVVGAPGAYGASEEVGVVHIFRASAPHDLLLTIPSPWPDECAGFGTAVALRRNVLVVSTSQAEETLASGSVAIYSVLPSAAGATLIGTLSQPGENGFGAAVACSGSHVAVGVPGGSAQVAGAVTVVDQILPKTPDLNHDGIVDGADLGILIAKFGPTFQSVPADLNSDMIVNGADLAILLAAWGTSG
jgi:hypothetical protein